MYTVSAKGLRGDLSSLLSTQHLAKRNKQRGLLLRLPLARAQSNLGAEYTIGVGVPKDLVVAYMWRNLAAAQGNEIAKTARDALETSMTPTQIAEAQKLSRECP